MVFFIARASSISKSTNSPCWYPTTRFVLRCLDEAGYQDVLAAFQAQYDEWKAENGSETTDESVEEESSSVAE